MDIQYAQSMVFTPCDFAFPANGVKAEATPNTEMILIADVDIDLLRIERRENHDGDFRVYRDFVTYIYNQMNGDVIDTFKKLFTFKQIKHIYGYLRRMGYIKPSDIPSEYYLELFGYFKSNGYKYTDVVKGYYQKHIQSHIHRKKTERTRVSNS